MAASGAGSSSTATSGTHSAIVVSEFGGPEVLKLATDVPTPTPGAGQVLIDVKAAGVNPADTYVRNGAYALLPELPYTPGADAAGTIAAVGEGVTQHKVGDRVYVNGVVSGSYATRTIAEAKRVQPLPDSVSFAQGVAAAGPTATAFRALFQRGRVRAGDTVLVMGASGGVGLAAVQLARAAGAIVIGTASTEEGRALVKRYAAAAFDHSDPPALMEGVMKFTDGAGVDHILENLANVNLGRDLKTLAHGGTVIVVGSRGDVQITPRDLMSREASVVGVMIWKASERDWKEIYAAVNAALRSGTLVPVVGQEFPLADASAAHVEVIEHAKGSLGKIVLTMEG